MPKDGKQFRRSCFELHDPPPRRSTRRARRLPGRDRRELLAGLALSPPPGAAADLARNVKRSYMKKTCPRCKAQVSVRAARCRHCRYSFPEKSSPWAAGPALGVGFPLVLMGVLT